jgi:hypothetical protein
MSRRPRALSRITRPRDWPLAAKIAVLFALSWTILATVLTTVGALEAESGLREQAELALASDGHQVATSIDDWHDLHVKAVLHVAQMPAIQKVMADPSLQMDGLNQAVDDNLRTASATYADTTSFGLLDLDGQFRYSSDSGDFENTTAGQRDFFREALVRDSFISGVQGSSDSTDLGRILLLRARSRSEWPGRRRAPRSHAPRRRPGHPFRRSGSHRRRRDRRPARRTRPGDREHR